jgi:hypothetical protein
MKLPYYGGRKTAYVPSGNPYAGQTLATFASGTFSRSSDGTYLTSATDVAVATTNVLRSENRGDGYGAVPLFEGARTNLCIYSSDLGSWTVFTTNTGTTNFATSPLGTTTAARVQKPTTAGPGPYTAANIGGTKAGTLSVWVKNNGGATATRLRFSSTTGIALPITVSSTWVRWDAYRTFTGAASENISWEHRLDLPNTGNPSIGTGLDALAWGVQLEAVVTFPSSAIINNSGSSATRSADTLTLTTSQYNTTGLQAYPSLWYVYPCFASTDLVDGDSFTIASFGDANSRVRIRKASGSVTLDVLSGGSVVVSSSAITFSRHQQLAVTVRPAEGTIVTSGASTGNGTVTGTPWTFANSTLRIGGIVSSTGEAFSRIAQPVGVL